MKQNAPRLNFRKQSLLVGLLLCSLLALPLYTYATAEQFPIVPEDGFAVVSRGSVKVSIDQRGDVQSGNNLTILNKCEWSTRIINLVPEGTWVEAGDIVAELDSSALRERFDERQVLLVNAEAAMSQAQEDVELQRLANESREANSELQVRLAALQLEGYTEAEHPQQLHELESSLALAEEELTRAEKNYEYMDNMVRLGYRNQPDRENERLKLLATRQKQELAADKLDVFNNHTHQRSLTKLKAVNQEVQFELERVKSAGRSALLTREIKLRSRERTYEIYRVYQERLANSIAACTIRAPKAGEVIYATISPRSQRKIEEGYSLSASRPIVHIPDRDNLEVKLRVHESLLQRIDVGNSAFATVDAVSGIRLDGVVTHVSKVPMPGQYPNYDLREYQVTVKLDHASDGFDQLAPGMTANVEILSGQKHDALIVPIQSVVRVAGRHMTFVRAGDEVQARDIEIGLANNDVVEIVGGLKEGEELVMKPRITCAKRISAIEGRTLTGMLTQSSSQAYWQ